jgi:hypothetical protein
MTDVTLTANSTFAQIQGTITSAVYDPSTKTYSLSGTSTSDDIVEFQILHLLLAVQLEVQYYIYDRRQIRF